MDKDLERKKMKRIIILIALLLIPAFAVYRKATGQEVATAGDKVAAEQWEYLVVAGASNTNFVPSGNPRMLKEPMGSFGRESFVLEQHLDRLGAKGWELVAVTGSPADPVYHFKRRK